MKYLLNRFNILNPEGMCVTCQRVEIGVTNLKLVPKKVHQRPAVTQSRWIPRHTKHHAVNPQIGVQLSFRPKECGPKKALEPWTDPTNRGSLNKSTNSFGHNHGNPSRIGLLSIRHTSSPHNVESPQHESSFRLCARDRISRHSWKPKRWLYQWQPVFLSQQEKARNNQQSFHSKNIPLVQKSTSHPAFNNPAQDLVDYKLIDPSSIPKFVTFNSAHEHILRRSKPLMDMGQYKEAIERLVDDGCGSEHYELLELSVRGSDGIVYKARPLSVLAKEKAGITCNSPVSGIEGDEQAEKSMHDSPYVAIKICEFKPEKYSQMANEIAVMRQLKLHPNLVRFVSAHLHNKDNTLWIAMGWIEGVSIRPSLVKHTEEARKKKERKPFLSEEQARQLVVPMFSALAAVHSVGVTHGDMHPGNLMQTQSGPMLIDVGRGSFKLQERYIDVLRLTYTLVECTVNPIMDATCTDPIHREQYHTDRKTAMRMIMKMIGNGEFEMPEGVRKFVKDIIEGFSETTSACDPLIVRIPF